jgi:hypothetical protein
VIKRKRGLDISEIWFSNIDTFAFMLPLDAGGGDARMSCDEESQIIRPLGTYIQ